MADGYFLWITALEESVTTRQVADLTFAILGRGVAVAPIANHTFLRREGVGTVIVSLQIIFSTTSDVETVQKQIVQVVDESLTSVQFPWLSYVIAPANGICSWAIPGPPNSPPHPPNISKLN
jgi:hypothetical protein